MALDSRIVLLIGAETAVVDESQYARTLTVAGNAARTTTHAKYGVASLTFDGTGDRVQAADSADFTLGSGDFTIEGWFRLLTKIDSQAFLGHWDSGGTVSNCSWFLYVVTGQLVFRNGVGGATHDLAVPWSPTLGQWYHLAVDRSGSTLRLYRDGVVVATNAAFADTLNDCSDPVTLGAIGTGTTFAGFDFDGQMDEVRITKGLAHYAGAFTPPTGPFPRDTAAATIRVTQDAVEVLSLPTPALRVTQDVVEVISASPALTGDPRVSQLVAEVVSHPTPAARITQLLAETITSLTAAAPPAARLTQLLAELATKQAPEPFLFPARVTQLLVEVLTKLVADPSVSQLVVETMTAGPPHPPGFVSQAPLELVEQYGSDALSARVSQAPLETVQVFAAPTVQARISQAPLETVQAYAAPLVYARVSQAALEIIYPFGCYIPLCTTALLAVDVVPASTCTSGAFPIDSVGTPPIEPPIEPPTDPCFSPAGTIMVGGFGDHTTCRYLSPNGATSYPQPSSAPVPGTGLSAFARTSAGHIALVGGNAPNFPTTGAGLFNVCALTVRNQYTGSRHNGFAVTADGLGYWYVGETGGAIRFTRLNAASAEVATWDIPIPPGYGELPTWGPNLSLLAMAVSADGQTMYCWLRRDLLTLPPTPPIHNRTYLNRFSLAGAGSWLNQVTLDFNYASPGYGSLLVVPGSTDVVVAFQNLNETFDGSLRRYTADGTLVWTAGLPAGAAGAIDWMGVTAGVPGDTHFLAWAYDNGAPTESSARYCWFSYATGAPDNTRNFTPADGDFQFDSQFVVLMNPLP